MNSVSVAQHTPREHTRTGLSVAHLKRSFIDNLMYDQGKHRAIATNLDLYFAVDLN